MSDFDKEAERERLREKYERDEEKREVTERMSELLLQGATMTNTHCSDCGDPIFRYDGQEFCATCQKAVQRAPDDEGADADGDQDGAAGTNGDREEIHVAAPDRETSVQFGGDAQQGDGTDAAAQADGQAEAPPQQNEAPAQPAASQPSDQPTATQPPEQPGSVDPGEYGNLGAAAAALSREITRLAQHVEATDDLGQKRALYEATEEAAEALEAVQDASR